MKVLVVGAGGAAHMLARTLASSPGVREVYCAPGNAGMLQVASTVDLEAGDAVEVGAWAFARKVDLVVCGDPEGMAAGVMEAVEANRGAEAPGG